MGGLNDVGGIVNGCVYIWISKEKKTCIYICICIYIYIYVASL